MKHEINQYVSLSPLRSVVICCASVLCNVYFLLCLNTFLFGDMPKNKVISFGSYYQVTIFPACFNTFSPIDVYNTSSSLHLEYSQSFEISVAETSVDESKCLLPCSVHTSVWWTWGEWVWCVSRQVHV